MCTQLRQIYDKKSPIFLTQIGMLVATIIILQYPTTCFQHLRTFQLITVVVSSTEIFLKSIGLAFIHTFNKQVANTVQTVLVGLFVVIHIGLWIYSILLLINTQFITACRLQQPNYFYIKVYVFMYGIVIIGSFILLIVMLIPVTVLTLFSFKQKQQVYFD